MSSVTRQFWKLVWTVESCTAECYRRDARSLLVSSKCRFLEELERAAEGETSLNPDLEFAVRGLLATADHSGKLEILLLRGLGLELLGKNLYSAAAQGGVFDETSRSLALRGMQACQEVADRASRELADQGNGDALFDVFAACSDDFFGCLSDAIDPTDQEIRSLLSQPFPKVVGDFVADLTTEVCSGLGMPRREVFGHLSAASMGI